MRCHDKGTSPPVDRDFRWKPHARRPEAPGWLGNAAPSTSTPPQPHLDPLPVPSYSICKYRIRLLPSLGAQLLSAELSRAACRVGLPLERSATAASQMRRSSDGVPMQRSSGRSTSSSCEIDWVAEELSAYPIRHVIQPRGGTHDGTFYLDPAVNNQPWSEREDMALIRAHQIYGNNWCEMAKFFPGRTGKAIKNHWNGHLRRKTNSDLVRGLSEQFPPMPDDPFIIKNKGSSIIKSAQGSPINLQVSVDWPIKSEPEQGLTENGRNASPLKEKGSMHESFPMSLQNEEPTNSLGAPSNGVKIGFSPAHDHVSIHGRSGDICSSADLESQELHLANIADLLDMSYCESLMIVPPGSPNDDNSMEGTGH
ncbi:hypothetical protein U9M48_024858 [Paspalum notatum var. saurae]|uniref:Uncharacterized protein n=1 Tax=Paspalum notatum var. saurae TaxID=547442 RepID=A0AAQ3WX03_PASNO